MRKSGFFGLMMVAGSALTLAGAGVANAQEASTETKSEAVGEAAMQEAAPEASSAESTAPDMSTWTDEQKAAYEAKKAQEMAIANAAMNAVDSISVAPGEAIVVAFSEEAGPGKMVVVSQGADAVDAPLLAGQFKANLAMEGGQAVLTVENGTEDKLAFGLGIDFDKSGKFVKVDEPSVGATAAAAFNLPATIGGIELTEIKAASTSSAMAGPAADATAN